MLLAAAADLNIDLSRSLLIGDRLSELKAGESAGLPWLGHVLTGHGKEDRSAVKEWILERNLIKSKNRLFNLDYLDTLLDFPIHLLNCLE